MAEVNLKKVQCENSDQDTEEDGSHGSKIDQRVIQRDSSPIWGKSFKKRKTKKSRRTSSSSQSRSPPTQRKKGSKKSSRKKRRSRSPSSSSSSSSSHFSSSESVEEDQETKRFHIVSNEDQFKWGLPSELASYANTQFEKYIPGKSIHDAICEVHIVPNNLNQVKKIDEFLRDLLTEKNKNNSLAVDEILGKIQKRTLSVMGPLSKVWLKLENAKKSDAPPLSLDEILSLPEHTICLLGQTSNSISYHRRCNILSIVCSPQEAKNLLKNEVELLQLSGLSLSDILKRGSWSNKTTWERFYNKPILTFEEKFQKAVN